MRGPCYADPLFYFLEKALPHVFFRVWVFGREDERGFAHDKVFGDGTDISGIPGVEDLVSGHEVPVFLERVFTDQGVTDVELAILRVYGSLSFVSDQVAV